MSNRRPALHTPLGSDALHWARRSQHTDQHTDQRTEPAHRPAGQQPLASTPLNGPPTLGQSAHKGGAIGSEAAHRARKAPADGRRPAFYSMACCRGMMAAVRSCRDGLSHRDPASATPRLEPAAHTSYRAGQPRSHANKLSGNLMRSAPTKTPTDYLHLTVWISQRLAGPGKVRHR